MYILFSFYYNNLDCRATKANENATLKRIWNKTRTAVSFPQEKHHKLNNKSSLNECKLFNILCGVPLKHNPASDPDLHQPLISMI